MTKVSKVGTFLLAATIAACATGPENSAPKTFDPDDPLAETDQALTPLATQCTFNPTTGLMTVVIAAGETAVIARSAADSAILQNGQACDNPVTASTLKKITVTGSSGDDTLLLDFTNGLFALGTTSAASSGIAVDLGGGTGDKLAIKGTSAADNFNFGAASILLNTDANKDITYTNVESFVVSLGDGDDVYTSAGGGAAGGVFGQPISVFGGPGNDVFNQGSAATVSETISGGSGIDTVSYASRSASVTVTIGAGANDGAAAENDDIMSDVEIVTGGTGDDTLTADATLPATLNGGPGNDTLIGGSGNDTISGGPGVDKVDYSGRSADITATLDGVTPSGDLTANEADILGSDVENLEGGSGDDVLTGNASANELVGNAGDDTLSGLGGDDTIEGGAGDDDISCGAGFDVTVGRVGTGVATSSRRRSPFCGNARNHET